MNTPDNITHLEPGQVFVFGSNAEGQHWAGAARVAHESFGAEWGVGEGLTGSTYAIPTMTGIDDLHEAVDRFLDFAESNADLTFLVTRIGCGIAGHEPSEVAEAFRDHPTNVIIPADFQAALNGALQ